MKQKSRGGKGNYKHSKQHDKVNIKRKRNTSNSLEGKRRRTHSSSDSKWDNGKSRPTHLNPKSNKQTINQNDSSGSDSDDAFSQLVASLPETKRNVAIVSEDETSSEEEHMSKEDTNALENVETSDVDVDSELDEGEEESLKEDDEPRTYNEDGGDVSLVTDPFEQHIQYDLNDELYEAVSSVPPKVEDSVKEWPNLGQLKISIPRPVSSGSSTKKVKKIIENEVFAKQGEIPTKLEKCSLDDWNKIGVKSQISGNILKSNRKFVDSLLDENDQLSAFQKELFSIINNYQDLLYPERTFDNGEEIRFVYCLHTINHVLKTRLKVVHHNARLANKQNSKDEIPDEFRDQGLIRPKVLILVPFRNSALRVLEMLSSILLDEGNNNVINKKRFYDEFTSGEIAMPRKNPKPEDYEKTFAGDTDDNFKVGISLTKKSLKLYTDFYSADIIIASPLGLRMIVGAEGQAERDFDFLASIELLVLDQAEIILMQNWDHLVHIWDHLHMQPKQSHGTNFARVRPWALSGRARYYRQTLIFSSHALPQISSLFTKKCHNYAGKVCVANPVKAGSICQVVLQLPQVFNKIDCTSALESIDARFNYFIQKVLPQYKESVMKNTVIYVPSYFDYVRIRNYFKKETVSFVQICEYSKEGKVARARDMFFHSTSHFLLYSERFHFFRRIRLKGIKHIIFYQPPTIPHFYSELCNLMQNDKELEEGTLSVSVLYSRYDAAQLAAIVGSDRAARMLASDRAVHMFMTGD